MRVETVSARAALVAEVAGCVPAPVGSDCVRVGVDGVDGAGKTTFAAELAAALRDLGRPVMELSIDGWHRVRAERYARGPQSPEGFWLDSFDFTVFVDVPFEVSAARMAVRDGSPPDPAHPELRRYVEAQRRYFAERAPWSRADLVVDNTDLAEPVLVTGRLD